MICSADTEADAERQYYDAVKYFYLQNPVPKEGNSPPGYTSPESLKASMRRMASQSMDDRRRAQKGELSFWEYDELGYIIAGTPERVAQRVREALRGRRSASSSRACRWATCRGGCRP